MNWSKSKHSFKHGPDRKPGGYFPRSSPWTECAKVSAVVGEFWAVSAVTTGLPAEKWEEVLPWSGENPPTGDALGAVTGKLRLTTTGCRPPLVRTGCAGMFFLTWWYPINPQWKSLKVFEKKIKCISNSDQMQGTIKVWRKKKAQQTDYESSGEEKRKKTEKKRNCVPSMPQNPYIITMIFWENLIMQKKKKKSFKKFKTPQNQRITNTTLIIIIIIFLSSPQSIMFNLTFIHLLSLWSRSLHAVWILGVQCNCRDWAIDPKIT